MQNKVRSLACDMASLPIIVGICVLSISFGAQAQDSFPKITPELYDKLNKDLDTTWPHDPAVPELPPMPVTDDPKPHPDAFLWTHFRDNVYPPRVEGTPTPRTRMSRADPGR